MPYRIAVGALLLLTALAPGQVTLRRDTVLPVIVNETLSMDSAKRGDLFTARVERDSAFGPGTVLLGEVTEIRPSGNGYGGSVRLEFTHVRRTGGALTPIRAVVVPWNPKAYRTGADGRWVVNEDRGKREGYVLGGLAVGALLGALIDKPFEGLVIGGLAGVIGAASDRKDDGKTILLRGQRVGALLVEDADLGRSVPVREDREPIEPRRSDPWTELIERRRPGANPGGAPSREDAPRPRETSPTDFPTREPVQIEIGDQRLAVNSLNAPYRRGNTWMVAVESLRDPLKLTVDITDSGAIYLTGDEVNVRLVLGETEYRRNGRPDRLPMAPERRDDLLYVPLDLVRVLTEAEVKVDGQVFGRVEGIPQK
jgi:hypothetical protein